MADENAKQATCPICGYTDSATDSEALALSMQEHMRVMHNQILDTNPANIDLKDTGNQASDTVTPGQEADLIVPPNNNAGNFGQFPGIRPEVDIPDHD